MEEVFNMYFYDYLSKHNTWQGLYSPLSKRALKNLMAIYSIKIIK